MPRAAPFQFNARAALFRDPNSGRFISRADVRAAIDRIIAASERRLALASDELRAGQLSLDDWQLVMREEIKRTQLDAELLARGGRAQMTQADFGRAGQRIRAQFAYLRDFARQLQAGTIRTDGGFLARAKMYAAAARGAFHASLGNVLASVGYTHERNLLAASEHCGVCVSETERGYVMIGELIPVGARTCISNCKCAIAYA